ncbi:hypothetical protein ZIOFF_054618 [Zingiber officinale]|uniref:Uncharacterized protein n=1 Tax=Zingiber officinale TaxID=94328 RepID=A0A8J5KJL8_ZINOF|nr:hypothetical protein ZIOFF_054618 [Zingiber officinale]
MRKGTDQSSKKRSFLLSEKYSVLFYLHSQAVSLFPTLHFLPNPVSIKIDEVEYLLMGNWTSCRLKMSSED